MRELPIVLVIVNLCLIGVFALIWSGAMAWIGFPEMRVTTTELWSLFKPIWLLVHCFLLPMTATLVWLTDKMCT